MNLDGATDKEFIEYVQRPDTDHQMLMDLLIKSAGQERRREIILAEVHKRQLHNLYTSSEKLGRLTWALIALTLILGILAVPPFVETVKNWLR